MKSREALFLSCCSSLVHASLAAPDVPGCLFTDQLPQLCSVASIWRKRDRTSLPSLEAA